MSIKKDVFSEIETIYPELVELRHQIHANPELSYAEFATAALIEEQLKKWEIPYVRLPDSTAIVATIRGQSKQSPCIGIRADMDALPIEEAANVSYQSQNKGIMHACGHDIHTVNLLGSGYVLNQLKNRFAGCVKLVFQPAEEVGGGAKELIDYGVLDNPKVLAFLAMHVSEDVPIGKIRVKAEEMMLASCRFHITLRGRGGHASAPHQTDDIVLAAAKLILEIQSIPTRKINYLEPAGITITMIHGGERENIIPKELTLAGTIRTQDNSLRFKIQKHIEKIIEVQELLTGVHGQVEFRLGSSAVYNDPALTKEFIGIARDVLGEDNVIKAKFPNNGSENFSRFSSLIPSVFFRVGVTAGPIEKVSPTHSSAFRAADLALKTSVAVTTVAAIEFLQNRLKQI